MWLDSTKSTLIHSITLLSTCKLACVEARLLHLTKYALSLALALSVTLLGPCFAELDACARQ